MQTCHPISVNWRLLSTQAALFVPAADGSLAALEGYMQAHGHPISIPAFVYLGVGIIGYALVFVGRLIPQPNVPADQRVHLEP